MDVFTTSKFDRHPTELAMLKGARMVTASETEEGKAWAEARIKAMTGSDSITAHFMRKDFFTFTPEFKLIIVGNHQPVLRNVDDAARRRFNIVPFIQKPENPDYGLEAKLMSEAPGIFRWMIHGCLDWQANGLTRPASVVNATREYFEGQDLFGQWCSDKCDPEPGNLYKTAGSGELFANWKSYAVAAGEDAGSQKRFALEMERRGFIRHRGSGGVREWQGIRLKPIHDYTESEH